jgi:hypothetical protein
MITQLIATNQSSDQANSQISLFQFSTSCGSSYLFGELGRQVWSFHRCHLEFFLKFSKPSVEDEDLMWDIVVVPHLVTPVVVLLKTAVRV